MKNLILSGSIVLVLFAGGGGDLEAKNRKIQLDDNEGKSAFIIQNSDKEKVFSVNSAGQSYFADKVSVGTSSSFAALAVESVSTEAPVMIVEGSTTSWITIDFQRQGIFNKADCGLSPPGMYGGNAFVIGSYNGTWTDTLVIENGAPAGSLYIESEGNIGVGMTSPTEKLSVDGNISATGSITQGSSREFKNAVASISTVEAMETLTNLNPVRFKYKTDTTGEEHLGFIAEDVPELVATHDRRRLNPMEISAVLVKVVQEQQRQIQQLRNEILALKSKEE